MASNADGSIVIDTELDVNHEFFSVPLNYPQTLFCTPNTFQLIKWHRMSFPLPDALRDPHNTNCHEPDQYLNQNQGNTAFCCQHGHTIQTSVQRDCQKEKTALHFLSCGGVPDDYR